MSQLVLGSEMSRRERMDRFRRWFLTYVAPHSEMCDAVAARIRELIGLGESEVIDNQARRLAQQFAAGEFPTASRRRRPPKNDGPPTVVMPDGTAQQQAMVTVHAQRWQLSERRGPVRLSKRRSKHS